MDIRETIQKPIKSELDAFKQFYSQQFISEVSLLNSALAHVAGTTGKMMRPMLLMLAAKSCGKINETTNYAAASLELLHTASLLHDDVVDESDMRRGLPSLNALYSNRIAILTGDYLFSSALFNASNTNNLQIIDGLSQLGRILSSGEMVQLQLQKNGGYSEEIYMDVIRSKTASLFACCARFGALSVGADEATVERFEKFGSLLGICFQIVDDIFDYSDNNIGKPTGSDMREGKITLPALYILANCKDEKILEIRNKLDSSMSLDDDEIALLIDYSNRYGGIEYAQSKIEELKAQALDILPSDMSDECREALEAYLEYVVSRKK